MSKIYDIADLISRVALRDRDAFDALYSQTSPKLFGVLVRLLSDKQEAEDALQEVYIKVWQKADRYATQDVSALAWLVAIARNHAIDRLRARKKPSQSLDDAIEVADGAPSPEADAVSKGEMARIEHCMAQLDADKAQAVRAAYLEGYSYQELADRYKTPLNTMRTWLRRSLLSLRTCLEKAETENRAK